MPDFGLPYAFSLYTNATDTVDERSAKTAVDAILRFMKRRGMIRAKVISSVRAMPLTADITKSTHFVPIKNINFP